MNQQLFIDTFGQEFIDMVTVNKDDSVRCLLDRKHHPGYFNEYYHNLKNYANRASHANFENFMDLYPSNVAILDYVIKNIDEFKGKTWLDFGGGIGMLGVYLNYLGIEYYIHDNYSQAVPRAIAVDFLKKYNLENRIIDNIDDVYKSNFHVVSSVGIWNQLLFESIKSLSWIFDDTNYQAKNPINGFERMYTDSLIIIYKRQQ
jgi:hypothetical protein